MHGTMMTNTTKRQLRKAERLFALPGPDVDSPINRIGDRGKHKGHQEDVEERPKDKIAEEEHQKETYQKKPQSTILVVPVLFHDFLPLRKPASNYATHIGFSRFSVDSLSSPMKKTQTCRRSRGPRAWYLLYGPGSAMDREGHLRSVSDLIEKSYFHLNRQDREPVLAVFFWTESPGCSRAERSPTSCRHLGSPPEGGATWQGEEGLDQAREGVTRRSLPNTR